MKKLLPVDFSVLQGLTIASVEKVDKKQDCKALEGVQCYTPEESPFITFTSACGRVFVMYHARDCCEYVGIEDITGTLEEIVGSPVMYAVEECTKTQPDKYGEYESSTFYTIRTHEGSVTIRWEGAGRKYYSQNAAFAEVVQFAL